VLDYLKFEIGMEHVVCQDGVFMVGEVDWTRVVTAKLVMHISCHSHFTARPLPLLLDA
jgi:hypothetical protein